MTFLLQIKIINKFSSIIAFLTNLKSTDLLNRNKSQQVRKIGIQDETE